MNDYEANNWMERLVRWCLGNRLVVLLLFALALGGSLAVAPFDWNLPLIKRAPVPVDAIPDIGENQQIVFTNWPGRSPQDVEDQITYPLTAALLGIPKVKTIRSYSYLGFSSIYIVFQEDAEFYWSRSRALEKLNSLPAGTLPDNVQPSLGPDATALGQVFWYTLEGRDEKGQPAPGWSPQELRSIQDYTVRYALQSVDGVSEVASIGGFVREYQIDVDPDAMRAFGITLEQVFQAVQRSNMDVGARTIEINRVEYLIRGKGFVENLDDLRKIALTSNDNVPVTLEQIATVGTGPAMRRGALDKEGAEAVGGTVVARYGANPMATIDAVKEKIESIAPGLPVKELDDGRSSRVTIVPFYDRSGLIHETLETLNEALVLEILITVVVVILLVWHLRSSLLISIMLPCAVLFAFLGMKGFGVDANIVALSGIAIAIGTIVDMGIVICESILRRQKSHPDEPLPATIITATGEVGSAVTTAVLTTVIGFLPVFFMIGPEGKLFRPLAFTKTFALVGSIIVALLLLPTLASFLLKKRERPKPRFPILSIGVALLAALWLGWKWRPLGLDRPISGLVMVIVLIGVIIGAVWFFILNYRQMLAFFLRTKWLLYALVIAALGSGVWSWSKLGQEFMPALDEGSFLLMPTTMPHASIGESLEMMQQMDRAISAIPEVETVVGKIGRVDSALDPAPVSMYETVINYKAEFGYNEKGERVRLWREHIQTPDDIWNEIVAAAALPGLTSAPKLQPIETRLIMLQTGMRAPMGIKVRGPDLETIEKVGLDLEKLLKEVPGVRPETVFADRIVGKPYLEIEIDREAIARYGMSIKSVQDVIEVAIGGRTLTRTVEGRERYPVRVRYQRELRDSIESIDRILIAAPDGTQIPLTQLADIVYTRGPQVIKSEDTFLVGYVIFGKINEIAEVEVVENAKRVLAEKERSGEFVRPAGVEIEYTGNYLNQIRASETLMAIMPIALVLIFILIYLQFRSAVTTFIIVLVAIPTAAAGGFLLLGLYNQPWFLNVFDLREVFQIGPMNLSVAVWVGFLALFGIATDDGVLMATYLKQRFAESPDLKSLDDIRKATLDAAEMRIRPAMMTTATTLLALLPVLTSTGRGSDVMIPMAIPTFGGMIMATLTVFVVPTIYCRVEEARWKKHNPYLTNT